MIANIDEFEVKDGDTKTKVFDRELNFKNKLISINLQYAKTVKLSTLTNNYERFTEDLEAYYNY